MLHRHIGVKYHVHINLAMVSKGVWYWILILVCLASCREKRVDPALGISPFHNHGAYILCEGNFGWGEGSIFYYDTSQLAAHEVNAYKKANGFGAGNVVHSLTISGDTAFLVVNNSNKVEILNAKTLKRWRANTTLISPRWVLPLGNRIWVTDLYANLISILDRETLAKITGILAPGWTEQIISHRGLVYVANRRQTLASDGDRNQQILVFDSSTLLAVDSIKLGGEGASALVQTSDITILTALEKDYSFNNQTSLVEVDISTRSVRHIPLLPVKQQQPTRVQCAGGIVFWLQGDEMRYSTDTRSVKSILPFGTNANLTSLSILWVKKDMARILLGDAKDYVSHGTVIDGILNLTTSQFQVTRTTDVGIIPGHVVVF